ncbi:MAG: hypothetical protein ACRCXC_07625 [Legionella sp.]
MKFKKWTWTLGTTYWMLLIRKTNTLFDLLSKLVLFILIIILFVPFSPKMPAPGLDPSWALGLNQAIAQCLAFGKEIIFTLGPYASIYTKTYHPATSLMMMAGCLYLAVLYWLSLIHLMKKARWYWILIYCIVLFGMLYSRDSLFFSYPLLLGIISFRMVSLKSQHDLNEPSLGFTFMLFTPLGLLPLVKGSMLILCVSIILLCCIFFLINKKKKLAVICLAATTVSIILFWLLAGQSIIDLPHYLISSLTIAAGFTEAMSSDGNQNEIIVYVIASASVFLVICWQKDTPLGAKIFLLAVFFMFLFVSFKTGFTRHYGHAFIPGTSILFAALFLPFLFNSVITYLLICVSLSSWYYINSHYTHISLPYNVVSSYQSAWHGFRSRIEDPYWLEKSFDFTMNFLGMQAAFPLLQGTTDIYSYEQTYLIASRNRWSPRPIFQSYSVFTSELAERNKEHLQGKNSPDNIIFRIEPIDKRVPSLEDGASWPLLLANYEPIERNQYFLVLQKMKKAHQITQTQLKSERHTLGDLVNVANKQGFLFIEVELKPTLLGTLTTIFFKPSPLKITFNLNNGMTKQYRFVASMAQSSFLISPLIENTAEFSLLYNSENDLNEKRVTSFVITANQEKNWHWHDHYVVKLKQINIEQ